MSPWEGLQQIEEGLVMIEEALEDIRLSHCTSAKELHDVQSVLVESRIAVDAISQTMRALHGAFH